MVNNEIKDLILSGQKGTAQFLHARELAAVMESLGCTDRLAREAGFADVFSFAEHHFATFQSDNERAARSAQNRRQSPLWPAVERALRKFSLSLAYVIPWMALLILEYLRPDVLKVSPELAGALSIALIMSLTTSGGFIQMISHSGHFYYGVGEPIVARQTYMALLNLGATSSLLLALLGLMLGSYFRLFTGHYLILAATNYVALSVLWMFCAVLAVQGRSWCIPVLFFLSASVMGMTKIVAHLGAPTLLTLWPVMAVVAAFVFVVVGFQHAERAQSGAGERAQPRRWVFAVSLVPFYLYGTAYFSFLFADRLAAGSAISWASGLSFGIDSTYKRGMDLALLAFLLTAALAEYLGDSFMHFWRRLATRLPLTEGQQLIVRLRRRHWKATLAIFTTFVSIALVEGLAFSRFGELTRYSRLWITALLGGAGYLLLSMALLDIIILASVKAHSMALSAVILGLVANVAIGYGLSHLWGVQYAAIGLLAGSACVFAKCTRAVRQVLRNPDYHYSVS